jgi:hypothetical protein
MKSSDMSTATATATATAPSSVRSKSKSTQFKEQNNYITEKMEGGILVRRYKGEKMEMK